MQLEGEIAVVTGGGSGIGRAIAQTFAAAGAQVVVADRHRDAAEAVADEITAAGGQAQANYVDVGDEQAVITLAKSVRLHEGRASILVNNAGLSQGDSVLDLDLATWDLNLRVVLTGAYLCCRAFLPGMLERRRGVILNISSVNGLTGLGEDAYSAAKAGLNNLTQNLAVRYGPQGIRVNAIAPGTIRTPIWQSRVAEEPDVFERLARHYPLRRVGEADDVAKAALFLCSDDAAWITGIVLPVDGGLLAGRRLGLTSADEA